MSVPDLGPFACTFTKGLRGTRCVHCGLTEADEIHSAARHAEVDALFPQPVMVDEERTWPSAKVPFLDGSSHLTCADENKLHVFAASIGLRPAWFQRHRHHPHYDLTPGRRALALRRGAIFVPAKEQARERLKKRGVIT